MSGVFHPILVATGDVGLVPQVLRALTKARVRNVVDVMDSEAAAFDYLLGRREERPSPQAPSTALAVVDGGGWPDFPIRVRRESLLGHVPLLVITPSKAREDAYRGLETAACLSPPLTADRFLDRLEGLAATRLRFG